MEKKREDIECQQNFGEFIREARKRRGLRQEDVAAKLKITKSYYGHIERGERNVDFILAIRICKILGLNLNEFLEDYM